MQPIVSSPQYAFAPVMFEKGGQVKNQQYGLAAAAENLREKGRYGDTVLAHITPEEAGILQLLGGSGTVNPYTGLPEFWNPWKDIKRGLSSLDDRVFQPVFRGINRGVESIAKALGPVGSIAAAYFGGPIGAALYQGFAAPGNKFQFDDAAKAAFLTYAGQKVGDLMSTSGTPGISGFGEAADSVGGAGVGSTLGGAPAPGAGIYDFGYGPGVVDAVSSGIPVSAAPDANVISYTPNPDSIMGGAQPVENVAEGIRTTATDATRAGIPKPEPTAAEVINKALEPSFADKALNYVSAVPGKAIEYIADPKNIIPTTLAATTLYGIVKSKQELDNQREEAKRVLENQEREKAEDVARAKQIMAEYPINYQRITAEEFGKYGIGKAAGGSVLNPDEGGISSLLRGGKLPPRYLKGGGDGMSDSIPARIGGKQEARLADGEFVVPADVVSHLGNGSSNAGAKKLYAMMDRVRQARTGKKRQAPKVRTERYMPV